MFFYINNAKWGKWHFEFSIRQENSHVRLLFQIRCCTVFFRARQGPSDVLILRICDSICLESCKEIWIFCLSLFSMVHLYFYISAPGSWSRCFPALTDGSKPGFYPTQCITNVHSARVSLLWAKGVAYMGLKGVRTTSMPPPFFLCSMWYCGYHFNSFVLHNWPDSFSSKI